MNFASWLNCIWNGLRAVLFKSCQQPAEEKVACAGNIRWQLVSSQTIYKGQPQNEETLFGDLLFWQKWSWTELQKSRYCRSSVVPLVVLVQTFFIYFLFCRIVF